MANILNDMEGSVLCHCNISVSVSRILLGRKFNEREGESWIIILELRPEKSVLSSRACKPAIITLSPGNLHTVSSVRVDR